MSTTARIARPTVLVVEDDPQLRDLYRSALLELPRVGGRDVHRELKSHSDTKQIPIIVVTGTDTSDLDAEAFASVLRKPISVDALVSAVEKCVRRAGGTPAGWS